MVLEKPIGTDLASSRAINDAVGAVFPERQVYRIDHYLGKETVLNLLALRFANSLFINNWDHNTIDHVQITVAEEVGIEGRWGYFDASGQLRDMVQNHLLQILTLVAIEPPTALDGDSIRDEKLKVLKALRPITRENVEEKTVRGQYAAGFFQGKPVPGYLEEEGGNPRSATETFAALRVDIDNWRWAGVPFYLRTGKRLAAKRSEVVIQFKSLPHNIFQASYRKLPAEPADHPAPARRGRGDRDAEQGPRPGQGRAPAADRAGPELLGVLQERADPRRLRAAPAGGDAGQPGPVHPPGRGRAGLDLDRLHPGRLEGAARAAEALPRRELGAGRRRWPSSPATAANGRSSSTDEKGPCGCGVLVAADLRRARFAPRAGASPSRHPSASAFDSPSTPLAV